MEILYMFAHEGGPYRFNVLQEKLEISPNTLSDRLKEMVEVGLLHRESFKEIPPRVEYSPTKMTEDMNQVFVELDRWAHKYHKHS